MQRKRKSLSLRTRISSALDLPPEALGRVSDVTVSELGQICVTNCKGVLCYTPQRVQLRLCRTVLTVTGEDLDLHTYFDGHMTVCGEVCCVTFEEGSACSNG